MFVTLGYLCLFFDSWLLYYGIGRDVVWQIVINVSDECFVSIFSSTLKMQAVIFSESLITIYTITQRYIQEASDLQSYRAENRGHAVA
jgi:hypothetical protein